MEDIAPPARRHRCPKVFKAGGLWEGSNHQPHHMLAKKVTEQLATCCKGTTTTKFTVRWPRGKARAAPLKPMTKVSQTVEYMFRFIFYTGLLQSFFLFLQEAE